MRRSCKLSSPSGFTPRVRFGVLFVVFLSLYSPINTCLGNFLFFRKCMCHDRNVLTVGKVERAIIDVAVPGPQLVDTVSSPIAAKSIPERTLAPMVQVS